MLTVCNGIVDEHEPPPLGLAIFLLRGSVVYSRQLLHHLRLERPDTKRPASCFDHDRLWDLATHFNRLFARNPERLHMTLTFLSLVAAIGLGCLDTWGPSAIGVSHLDFLNILVLREDNQITNSDMLGLRQHEYSNARNILWP